MTLLRARASELGARPAELPALLVLVQAAEAAYAQGVREAWERERKADGQ